MKAASQRNKASTRSTATCACTKVTSVRIAGKSFSSAADGFDARLAPFEALDAVLVTPGLDQGLVEHGVDADVACVGLDREQRGGARVRAIANVQHAQRFARSNQRAQMFECREALGQLLGGLGAFGEQRPERSERLAAHQAIQIRALSAERTVVLSARHAWFWDRSL